MTGSGLWDVFVELFLDSVNQLHLRGLWVLLASCSFTSYLTNALLYLSRPESSQLARMSVEAVCEMTLEWLLQSLYDGLYCVTSEIRL